MTPDRIALVRTSFTAVAPQVDDLAFRFYGRLFTLAPELRPLFKHDLRAQGRKLFQTLAAVVDGLDRLDEIMPVARALALRHVDYGAKPYHYRLVGAALLDTLRGALGPRFDPATEDAWEDAYTLLSDAMLAAVADRRTA